MSAILSKTFEQTVSILKGNRLLRSESEINLIRLEGSLVHSDAGKREDRKAVIQECIESLKERTQDPRLTLNEKRECLLIIMHLTSVHENIDSMKPFVIRSIEDANTIFDKCLGYTVLDLMHETFHSDAYLAVNTLLKDVSSRHNSVVCYALNACTFLMDVDLIPVFLPPIEKLIKSSQSRVKSKALCVLHRMFQIGPEYLVNIWDTTVKALCDKDPRIMSCSLPLLLSLLCVEDPPQELKIPKKVIFILKQVEQGCLPIDMMYGGVSGPWIQMRLTKIIGTLSRSLFSEDDFSELACIFKSIFERLQSSTTVQYAIIVECVQTIVSFHPCLEKVETVSLDMLEKFLTSKNVNLLLSGVELLKSMVKIKPGHSKQYAGVLLNCLSGKNSVLIKHVLSLIKDLVSQENSEHIINTMVKKLEVMHSSIMKKECLLSLLAVVEKYPMGDKWILENYLSILGCLEEDDMDEAVVKSMLKCLKAAEEDSLCLEAKRLASCIKHDFTASKYCMVLEILLFYGDKDREPQCKTLLQDILLNCSSPKWTSDQTTERLTLLSWDVYLHLATRHNVPAIKMFSSQNIDFKSSLSLQQKFTETKWMLENLTLAKSTLAMNLQDLHGLEIDSSLSFLDEHIASIDDSSDDLEVKQTKTDEISNLKTEETTKLKFKPYSKSRFDQRETDTAEPTHAKKVFLDKSKAPQRDVNQVWDKSSYQLEESSSKLG